MVQNETTYIYIFIFDNIMPSLFDCQNMFIIYFGIKMKRCRHREGVWACYTISAREGIYTGERCIMEYVGRFANR